MAATTPRTLPRVFNDGWRAQWCSLITLPAVVPAMVLVNRDLIRGGEHEDLLAWLTRSGDLLLLMFALTWLLFTVLYTVWTHLVFGKLSASELERVSARLARQKHSLADQLSGFGGALSWSVGAAATAIGAAILVTLSADKLPPLVAPLLAIAVAGASWVSMTYAYALRYARLAAAGDRFRFDIAEPLRFRDYLSLAFLVSTMLGSDAHPETSGALRALRGHAMTAFVFNAVVVALTVSLLIRAMGG